MRWRAGGACPRVPDSVGRPPTPPSAPDPCRTPGSFPAHPVPRPDASDRRTRCAPARASAPPAPCRTRGSPPERRCVRRDGRGRCRRPASPATGRAHGSPRRRVSHARRNEPSRLRIAPGSPRRRTSSAALHGVPSRRVVSARRSCRIRGRVHARTARARRETAPCTRRSRSPPRFLRACRLRARWPDSPAFRTPDRGWRRMRSGTRRRALRRR